MKRKRSLLCLVLIIGLLATLLCACAPKQPQTPQTDEILLETPDLTFYFYDTYQRGHKTENIEAYVRRLTREKLGLVVDVVWVPANAWSKTVVEDFSRGDPMDVICLTESFSVVDGVRHGMLRDLSPYLADCLPQTQTLMREYLPAYRYDGGLYGIPAVRSFCQDTYLIFNGKLLDNYGLRDDAWEVESFSELEVLLQKIDSKVEYTFAFGAKEGLWAPGVLAGGDAFAEQVVYDDLADPLQLVFCEEGVVTSVVEQGAYQAACARVADWQEKGWFWPDSARTVEDHQSLLKRDQLFCSTLIAEPGLQEATAHRADVVAVRMAEGILTSSDVNAWGVGVSACCEKPEDACRFIELLYTDAELLTALVRGLEHEDYLRDGDVIVVQNEYLQNDGIIGNQLLLPPVSTPDYYERIAQANAQSARSETLGFAPDLRPLEQARHQLAGVRDLYHSRMVAGEYSEALYAEYLAELDKAGLSEYLAAFQTQLDAWLAQ